MKQKQVNAACLNPAGNSPDIVSSVYIDASARVIGRVEIGPGAYVGPNAVIRSDEMNEAGEVACMRIGPESNVQDGVILHSLCGHGVTVGSRVSLSHGCIVHGPCTIGDNSFVGFRAVVFRAVLGRGTYVGTGAIVECVELPPDTMVPAGLVINSAGAVSRLSKVGEEERAFMRKVVETNLKLAKGYLKLEQKH